MLLTLTTAVAGSSCTVLVREQRRTLNLLDGHLTPSGEVARALLLPVSVPVGLVGLASDMVVVNPVLAVDDAWGDTIELLWTPTEDESGLRRATVAPLAAIATPFVFVGDWLGRCLFPIDPREVTP
ncbi:MAG: hypothetical protein KDE27_28280 [Planctomycetes bacterium]|nr:hypothetical protein [Planctomycetota bacterium]